MNTKKDSLLVIRKNLGADFIAPEEVSNAFSSVTYSEAMLNTLSRTRPSTSVVRWCRQNGYAVIPAPPDPMSILDIHNLEPRGFYYGNCGWYAHEEFAQKDKTSFGWLLMGKTPAQQSLMKSLEEQKELVSQPVFIPNAPSLAWFAQVYHKVRGVRLFPSTYARTSSYDSRGDVVLVGYFFLWAGLSLNHSPQSNRCHNVGLAVARKG